MHFVETNAIFKASSINLTKQYVKYVTNYPFQLAMRKLLRVYFFNQFEHLFQKNNLQNSFLNLVFTILLEKNFTLCSLFTRTISLLLYFDSILELLKIYFSFYPTSILYLLLNRNFLKNENYVLLKEITCKTLNSILQQKRN